MKNNENKDAAPDTVSAGDQQNRREFFNGLGKWSMIVVAAVSFLRGSATQVQCRSRGNAKTRMGTAGDWRSEVRGEKASSAR